MDDSLQHEDLLIKLRAKLNLEKIKLWEAPYLSLDNSSHLEELANKYAAELQSNTDEVLQALRELQVHSIERSKANEEFKETGLATLRVKANIPGEKPRNLNVMMKLNVAGSELIEAVAMAVAVERTRVKLIVNGKVIKPTPSIEEQGVRNGIQILALVMTESPEEVKKEDTMYMEMKKTRDDATLLSEYVDDHDDGDEYMKLEDQSGQTVELPAAERRSLLVGLTLHERGRAAIRNKDYSLALVLLLEADRLFSECRSSILARVDNISVLQLDIAWCYICLRSLQHASDASRRLASAERGFIQTYGENRQRLVALKGTDANERVLFMRLYLLQGVVAYHQNRRDEARALLEKAEVEIEHLKVDEDAVAALVAGGWAASGARAALRAAAGDERRARAWLRAERDARADHRDLHRARRRARALGLCEDGTPVAPNLVEALVGMGFRKRIAITALRNSNNHVAEAVKLIQEEPEMLAVSEDSCEESMSNSDHSLVEPDEKLVCELEAMGYQTEEARNALKQAGNDVSRAVDLLHLDDPDNPSTSASGSSKTKKAKRDKDKSRKKEREAALARLTSTIQTDEEGHLDTSLVEEQEILDQYKSLL